MVILDLGLPDIDGIDVCRALRAARLDLAILILTARDQERDVVGSPDAGADDYVDGQRRSRRGRMVVAR